MITHIYKHLTRLGWTLAIGCAAALQAQAQWTLQNTNFTNASTGVNNINVVSASTVWATGYDGSGTGSIYHDFTRTTDGGTTWVSGEVTPADATFGWASLSAVSASTAYAAFVNSANGGGQIFKTTNGGSSWTQTLATGYVGTGAYLNAVHFASSTSGVAMGDPVNSEFEIYYTSNGTTWTAPAAANIPAPVTGEFGLLDVLVSQGTSNYWFGTSEGRVFRSTNGGVSWQVTTTGLASVSRLAFASATNGLAVELGTGGLINGVKRTTDGGATWSTVAVTGTLYASDLKAVPGTTNTYVSCGAVSGASGSSYSTDGGTTWTVMESAVQRTAIGAASASAVWAGNFTSATLTGGIFKGAIPTTTPTGPQGSFTWARQTGAALSTDRSLATVSDANGNVYVAGFFNNTATFGSFTVASAGLADAYVAKYNASGTALWVRTVQSANSDLATALALDAAGNVYLGGTVSGAVNLGVASFTGDARGDAFIAKYSDAGVVQWARIIARSDSGDNVTGLAIAGSPERLFVTGNYGANATLASTPFSPRGGMDGYLTTINTTTSSANWIRSFGSTDDDYAAGLGATASMLFVVGDFGGNSGATITFGTGGGGTSNTTLLSQGLQDGFVAYYSPTDGNLEGTDRVASGANDAVTTLTLQNGRLYIGGYIGGIATLPTGLTLSPATAGTLTAFVAYPSFNQGWGKLLNSTDISVVNGLSVSATGDLLAGGYYYGTAVFNGNTYTATGQADGFVTKYDPANGTEQKIWTMAGSGNDITTGVLATGPDGLYACGYTTSPTLAFGAAGILTNAQSGTSDGWLTRLTGEASPCNLATPTLTASAAVCEGGSATLTAGNVAAGATILISGQGATWSTSPVSFPNVSAGNAGLYTLTVTLGACSTSAQVDLVVNPLPAQPLVAGASRCGAGTLPLRVTNAAAGVTYRWYSTSSTSTVLATGVSYTTASLSAGRSYFVEATTAAGCSTSRIEVSVAVLPQPTVSVTASGSVNICTGQSLTLTATGINIMDYLWSNSQTGASITVSQGGSYTVTASNGDCQATSTPIMVTVNAIPESPTTTSGFRCGPGIAEVTALSTTPGVSYRWYDQQTGGAQLVQTSQGNYTTQPLAATTTYYVSAAGTGNCESTRTIVLAYIRPLPTVALIANGPTSFCEGDSVRLSATFTSGADVRFERDGLLEPGSPVPSIWAKVSGLYTAIVTTALGCSTTSAPITVTANPRADASFSFAQNTLCLGGTSSVNPTIQGTSGGNFTVSPNTGLVVNSSTGQINLAQSMAGTYAITYAVGGQCPASTSQTITLTAAPQAAFAYTPSALCTGGGTAMAMLAPGSQAGRFTSTTGLSIDGFSGNIILSSSTPGTYQVINSVAASGTCPAALATASLTIMATPAQPSITTTPNADGSFTLESSVAAGIQWYRNGAAIVGATSSTLWLADPSQSGTYTVVAANGACSSEPSAAISLTITATGKLSQGGLTAQVLPNPAEGATARLSLAGLKVGAAYRLSILDAVGRVVYAAELSPVTASVAEVLPIGALKAGLFHVSVSGPGQQAAAVMVVR